MATDLLDGLLDFCPNSWKAWNFAGLGALDGVPGWWNSR